MTFIIFLVNFTFLFSFIFDVRFKGAERRFSFGLIRVLLFIPLLAVEYLCFGVYMQGSLVEPLFFSEIVFGLIWLGVAYNLPDINQTVLKKPKVYLLALTVAITIILCAGTYWLYSSPAFQVIDDILILPYHGQFYFSSLFLLVSVLIMAWRVEAFWRALPAKDRYFYKYLVLGFLLISGSLGWAASFRIVYLYLSGEHFLLLSIFMLIAWLLIGYAVVRNRLLNRKIFVSRKVIYTTIAPITFACYLISLGLISLLMRSFGWSMDFVLQWLMVVSGVLLIAVLALSARIRAKVKFFISTHFYVNKYEYRDEWLAFSSLLQGKLTESDVVDALRQILDDSLYTDTIKIWLGDEKEGFRLTGPGGKHVNVEGSLISADDPLIIYLKKTPYLNVKAEKADSKCLEIQNKKNAFFSTMALFFRAYSCFTFYPPAGC